MPLTAQQFVPAQPSTIYVPSQPSYVPAKQFVPVQSSFVPTQASTYVPVQPSYAPAQVSYVPAQQPLQQQYVPPQQPVQHQSISVQPQSVFRPVYQPAVSSVQQTYSPQAVYQPQTVYQQPQLPIYQRPTYTQPTQSTYQQPALSSGHYYPGQQPSTTVQPPVSYQTPSSYQPSSTTYRPSTYQSYPNSYQPSSTTYRPPIYQAPPSYPSSYQPSSTTYRPPVYQAPQSYQGYQQPVPSYVPQQSVFHPMAPTSQPQCECGMRKTARIVGGEKADIFEFPFSVGLLNLGTKVVFCGGTIISANFVLTSAHCFDNRTNNEIGLLVGCSDYSKPSESHFASTYQVAGVIPHPNYDRLSLLNDIALVKSIGQIQFNPAVQPVCLPIK